MSLQDPIADLLTQIRNAQMAKHPSVTVRLSKQKESIVKVLSDCGYVGAYEVIDGDTTKKFLKIALKYYQGKPVIEKIKRISSPGLRVYCNQDDIPSVKDGLGVAILSTNKGVITDKQARAAKVGGEVLCIVE